MADKLIEGNVCYTNWNLNLYYRDKKPISVYFKYEHDEPAILEIAKEEVNHYISLLKRAKKILEGKEKI